METSSVAVTDTSSVHCFDQLTKIWCFAWFEASHVIEKKVGWLRIIDNKTIK